MSDRLTATASAAVNPTILRSDLEASVDGEVRFDDGSRAAYATDASNFRQVPIAVVVPRTVEAAKAAVAVCYRHRVPLLSRGGGTSLAGQCFNTRGRDRLVEVLPDPAPLDADLRLGADWHPRPSHGLHFAYPDDDGSFVKAANRCVGVGKCRQHDHSGATVMCPSYQVTHEEKHATRGRARLLFEMLDGHSDSPVRDG